MGQKYTSISDLYKQVKLNEQDIIERKLTPQELEDREKIAKKLPMADFKKRYGKDAMAVKMATATNIVKKKSQEEETELDENIPKSTMYALVKDGKVIAKGSKRDMTSKMKKEGGKIFNAPSKKVGDTMKESLDEKFTKKDFAKNEDENQHTKNAIELVKMFGTSAENIKVNAIAARHNMKGSISRKDQQDRDALIKKYYPKLKEGVELDEDAKMAKQSDDNLKSMMKKMRDAEKKDPKLPSTQFMIKRIGKEMKKRGLKEMNESKSSSGYDLYHKDFSSAMQHAYGFAKKKYGITIDPKEIDDKVATGPRKPSKGKVNKYRLKGDKGTVQIQVTNLDNKRFELNMYKEEVNMNEAKYKYDGKVVKISKKEFAKVHKDYKNSTKGKERMMILDPKTQGSISVPVKFEELDATVQSVVEALSAGDNVREQRRMSPAARARRDALRDMDARKKGSDDEVKATDADREKADRNIINKLKKAADVKNEKGSFEIKFDKGPARKVPSRLASLVLQKFNKLKPADKLKFQKQAEKSYADFLRAVKDMTK